LLTLFRPTIYSQNWNADTLEERLSYFSLQIGDYWQYIQHNFIATVGTSESYFSIEIKEMKLLENGENYFCIESSFEETYFVRIDTTTGIVYQYNTRLKIEYVMHDLFSEIGDDYFGSGTYFSYPSYPSLTKQYCDSIVTDSLLGISTKIKKFCSPDLIGEGNMQYFAYAQYLGLTHSFFDFQGLSQNTIELIYAKISGIEYGTKYDPINAVENEILFEYSLAQNYPNPFNPTTTIEYSITELNNVQLIIYNVLGQKITTLVNEVQPPGNYEVSFDGSSLTSGVYYYQIRTQEFVETRKMLLVR
jgi:hypothetical protein